MVQFSELSSQDVEPASNNPGFQVFLACLKCNGVVSAPASKDLELASGFFFRSQQVTCGTTFASRLTWYMLLGTLSFQHAAFFFFFAVNSSEPSRTPVRLFFQSSFCAY